MYFVRSMGMRISGKGESDRTCSAVEDEGAFPCCVIRDVHLKDETLSVDNKSNANINFTFHDLSPY